MKYAIIIPDGCADEPQESLGGKTPLEAACTPAMDAVAQAGVVGRASHVPEPLPAGSETANMSLLGYDPLRHFTGRAPIEAAAQGIHLAAQDWAVRCNLVTIQDQVMRDFTAGHISTEEAAQLLQSLQEAVDLPQVEFRPGVSYRNLMLFRGSEERPAPFSADTRTTAPHDLTDLEVVDHYPRGPGSDLLVRLMQQSVEVFRDHPVNRQRHREGKSVATNVWLWGLGQTPQLEPFARRFGLQGAMITAVDLLRGLARLIGWEVIEVPGATGYLDTDYAAKGRYAVEALERFDIVCVHIEAPDEASHEGNTQAKVESLEQIDRHIVAPVLEALQRHGVYRILVTPDHPTPLRTKMHSRGWVPLAAAGQGIPPDESRRYDEPTAAEAALEFPEGWAMMDWFIAK